MRHVLAAALGAAVLATAADGRAATITDITAFSFVLDSRVTPEAFRVNLPFVTGADLFFGSGQSLVSLVPFDAALGGLRGVEVSLESSFTHASRHLIFSLGTVVEGLSYVDPLQLRIARREGGQPFTHETDLFFEQCSSGGQACFAVAQTAGAFEFTAADDPAAYLSGGPVEFSLVLDLRGGANYFFSAFEQRAFFGDSVTTWSGALRVTYDYEPAVAPPPVAAPAPESASLLALGLAGLWLHRSAKTAGRKAAAR